MDRVRFGRALGYGARHAARALTEAAKAATGESSRSPTAASVRQPPVSAPPSSAPRVSGLQEAAANVAEAQRAVSQAKAKARSGARQAGRSALAPMRRVGSVLWLEMTGSAFALIAFFLAPGIWKLRGALHASPSSTEAHKFYLYLAMLLLFTYFAISSFLRAHQRGRKP